jgi:hypothetical protein
MARRSWPAFFATVIALVFVLANRPVAAQEPFYKGKTFACWSIILPAAPPMWLPGWCRDIWANILPAIPQFAVQNMPGGGGNVGANYVYEVASPDGLTVGVFSGGYLPQILGGAGVRFDLNKMR